MIVWARLGDEERKKNLTRIDALTASVAASRLARSAECVRIALDGGVQRVGPQALVRETERDRSGRRCLFR